jgi:glycosyltransferase involved in cell wall biosynthesis
MAREIKADRRGDMAGLRVLIISFTDTSSEPRVLRQVSTLERRKIPFVIASFAPPDSHNGASNFIALKDSILPISSEASEDRDITRQTSLVSNLGQILDRWTRFTRRLVWTVIVGTYGFIPLARKLVGANPLGKVFSRAWFRLGWRETGNYSQRINQHLENMEFEPSLVLFHDYSTSKLAFEISEKYGARTLFDVHEHAITQYSNRPGWLKFISPIIQDIEGEAAKKCDALVTVGEEIRKLLGEQYGVSEKTLVVRSVAQFSTQPLRPSSYPLKLLYSGAISPERGLAELVKAMVALQNRFSLTIKGPVTDPKFESGLHELVSELSLEKVIKFEEPCDYEKIVDHANAHDIGFFVQPNTSKHKLYSLPNKFFSYVAAGLALCVSNYPELSRISREWGFAVLVDDCSPEAISDALSELSIENVDSLKRRALMAAKELNWEKEELTLIKILEELETISL